MYLFQILIVENFKKIRRVDREIEGQNIFKNKLPQGIV